MRYYEFAIRGVVENIKVLINEKECLREYRYDNPLYAVNRYMYYNLKNNLGFLAYRHESADKILAVLFFDEKRERLEAVYDYIIHILESVFEIKRMPLIPSEITMYEFMDCLKEARRRRVEPPERVFVELSNLFIYEYYMDNSKSYHFKFEEKIIPETKIEKTAIYDEDFIKELSNIELHSNNTEYYKDCRHVYKTEVKALNVGCMKTWINYEPKSLKEILEYRC